MLLTNNAPVLVHTSLAGYAERDTAQANLGVLVSSLTGGISDADQGAVKGIAIVGTDQAHGTVQYSANNGSTWTNVGSVSMSNALLLPADSNTRVRLVPTDTYLGTITDGITFRAWDQTSGTADTYADTTTNGGSTAFSTATDTVSLTIDPMVGSQSQVDTDSSGTHSSAGTALDGQGNSATAWLDGGNLYARGYQRGGTPISGQFQVNTSGTTAANASVAMNSGGTAVYAWTTLSGSTYTVWAERFNNTTGAHVDSAPVSLFTATGLSNLSIGIAGAAPYNNSIVVKYQTLSGSTTQVVAKLFNSSNALQSTVTVATATSPSTVGNSTLSVGNDGTFTVAWQSLASSNYSLLALRYTATGGYRDTSTPITVLSAQSATVVPSVSEQSDGGFAVAWEQGTQIWARHYTTSLSATSAVEVATSAGYPPTVASDSVGDFGVAWGAPSSAYGLWGRFYSSAAAPESDAFLLDTGDPGSFEGGASLAADPQGDFAAAWSSVQSSNTQILSQRLQLNQAPTATTIPPVYAGPNSVSATLNVANNFSDVDTPYRDQLTYTASSGNTSLVTTSVSGNLLTLNYLAQVTSSVTITVNATDLLSHVVSTTFTVNPNNAPVLTHTALAGSAERDTTQPNPGVLVSSLTGGISDADTSALKGIAIVGTDQAHGTIQYSLNGGTTWTNVGTVSTTSALLLAADANTRVRIVSTDAFVGTITDAITLRAWDQTSGTAGTTVDTTSNGGNYAFSTATDTVSMTIDPAVGPLTQANSDSTGSHNTVGTALDGQGNSVVAWTIYSGSTTNLVAASYQASGTQIGSQFQVNASGTSVSSAAVAMNSSGTSIFVWSVYSSGTYTVYSQRFNNSTGAAIDASPVSLFSNTTGVSYLSVGIAASSGFVVGYSTYASSTYTAYARMYSASNVLQSGSPITVTSVSSLDGLGFSVAGDGSFVVDWTSYASSNYQIQAVRYTAMGTLRDTSTPLQVLAPQSGYVYGPSVAEQADGSFVVGWSQYVSSSYQIWARRFNSAASGATAIQVNTQPANYTTPAVAVDSQGDFGVEWFAPSPGYGAWGRFYNASSQPESDAFQIDIGDPGFGYGGLALGANAQGNFQAALGSEATNYSSMEILTQRLQPSQAPTNTASIPTQRALTNNDPPATINLANYFSDIDVPYRDSLSYSVTGNTNTGLLTPGITGSTLTLTYANGASGVGYVTIQATDTTGLSVSASFNVIVQTTPLAIDPIGNQSVSQGHTLTFTANGSDLGNPGATLTYSLDSGAPSGATINSATGVFSWTPTNITSGLYQATVRVTDNGSPPLTASQVVNITVNTAPVLAQTSLEGFSARDTTQPNQGLLVSSLIGGITDADSGAVKGIAIVGVDQTHGTIQYSTNNGTTWTNVGAVSNSNALLLAPDAFTRVRLVSTDTFLGTVSDAITFRAWDQTSGTADTYVNATTNGGSTAFSSATATIAMAVDAIVGPQLQANTDTAASHTAVGTALDAQGNSVVAWTSNLTLMARSYLRNGPALGNQFQVTPSGTSISGAAVAMNATGTSIFVWSVYSSGTYTVYSQRFNNTTGAKFDASPVTLFSNSTVTGNLSVGIASSGWFVVGYSIASSNYTVMARVYNATNAIQFGGPITVASVATLDGANLSVAADGSFVVDWASYISSGYQIQALRYTSGGVLRDTSTPLQVLSAQSAYLYSPSVAEQSDGSFVVAWGLTSGVWARRFNSSAVGATAVQVSQISGTPAVAVDAQGDFGVVWNNTYGVTPNALGRFYNASSQPESDAFPVDPNDPGISDYGLGLAADAAGDFEAAWSDTQSPFSQVSAQRLQLDQVPTFPNVAAPYGSTSLTVNLSQYFSGTYTYAAASSNSSLVTTSVSGSVLTLTYPALTGGMAVITVTATDPNNNVTTTAFGVQLLNAAPVLVQTSLTGYTDRDPAAPNQGLLVSKMTGGISDPDLAAAQGIAIVGVDQINGTVQYSTDNGSTWTDVALNVSNSNALLLPADLVTRVRFVSSGAYLGTVSDAITFRAWDQTSGAAAAYVDTTTNGGSTAFSVATATLAMAVEPLVGPQTQVDPSTSNYQSAIGAPLDGQGNSVVAWTYYSGSTNNLVAASFLRDGTQIGNQFQVNASGTSVSSAAVAMNAGGMSIFVWSVYSSGTYTVYSQRFNNSTGAAIDASPVSLFSNPTGVSYLSVGIAASDGFVVGYSTYANSTYTAYARVYDETNALQSGSPIAVASVATLYGAALSVAADGSFVVAWGSYASSNYQIQALRYTSSGVLRDTSTPLQVLAPQSASVSDLNVVEQSDGSFVTAWTLSSNQLWIRRFNSSAVGATAVEVTSQAVTISSTPAALAVDGSGDFGILWFNSNNVAPNVWGQFFNTSSQPETSAFAVDANDPGYGYGGLCLAADAAGDFEAAWTDEQGFKYEILTQRGQPNQTVPTLTFTSSANPANYGTSVAFTVTVAPQNSGAAIPTGTITFMDGSTCLGQATMSGVNDQVTFTPPNILPTGSNTITAYYNGDGNYTDTSKTLTEIIDPVSSSTALTASPTTVYAGQQVTLTATVSAISGLVNGMVAPTGSVTFWDGNTQLDSTAVSLNADVATYSTSSLSVGSHTITADYSGDSNYLTSSQNVSVVVNSAATLQLPAIPNQIVDVGNTLSLSAAVISSVDPLADLTYSLASGAPAGASIGPATAALTWTPSAAQSLAIYPITVHVADSVNPSLSASETFSVSVSGIVDNSDPGYSETGSVPWQDNTDGLGYDQNYRIHATGDGSDTAQWTFSGLAPGAYDVYSSWIPSPDAATNAPYTILGGNTAVGSTTADQTQLPNSYETSDGTDFANLGTFSSQSGSLTVELNDNANGSVSADAIRLVPVVASPPVIQQLQAGPATIVQGQSLLVNPVGVDEVMGSIDSVSFFDDTNGDGSLDAGDTLLGTETDSSDGWDFLASTAGWALGEHTLFAEATDANGATSAPVSATVDVVPIPPVIDDSDPNFFYTAPGDPNGTANWTTGSDAGGFDGEYLTHPADSSGDQAIWTFNAVPAGNYQVQATWVADSGNSTAAPYTVLDGSTALGTVDVDQTHGPAGASFDDTAWSSLGDFSIDSGTLMVQLTATASGSVAADAVRLVPVATGGNAPPSTSGIGDVSATQGGASTVINLSNAFTNPVPADGPLEYEVVDNTNPGVFAQDSIDQAAGTLTLGYSSNPAAWGMSTLIVEALAPNGEWTDVSFDVNVAEVNLPPVASAITETDVQDQPLFVDLSSVATDPNDDPLTVTNITAPSAGGTAVPDDSEDDGDLQIIPDGPAIDYMPPAGFTGIETFAYTVADPSGATATATVTVDVTPSPTAPPADNLSETTAEESPLSIDVVTANSDNAAVGASPGDVPAVTSQPADGTAQVQADNTILYTPNPLFRGTDSFTYSLDGSPGTISIDVTPIDHAPVATSQDLTTNEDAPLPITLSGIDVDGDSLTYAIVASPQNGTLSTLTGGQVTYTPNAGFSGTDSFVFKANDGQLDSQDTPVTIAVNQGNYTVQATSSITLGTAVENVPFSFNVHATDSDPAAVLSYTFDSAPQGATITQIDNDDATVTWTDSSAAFYQYTAGVNYGDFGVRVTDTSDPSQTTVANVGFSTTTPTKILSSQGTSATVGQVVTVSLAASNNLGPGAISFTLVDPVGNAALTPTGDYTASLTWTPTAADAGTVRQFHVHMTDSLGESDSAVITVGVASGDGINSPIINPPMVIDDVFTDHAQTTRSASVGTNDFTGNFGGFNGTGRWLLVSGPDQGTLADSYTDPTTGAPTGIDPTSGLFTYTPPTGFVGTTQFTYDFQYQNPYTGLWTDVGNATATINVTDNAPVVLNAAFTTSLGAPPLQGNVSGGDPDNSYGANDPLTWQLTDAAGHPVDESTVPGLQWNGDGTFVYTPSAEQPTVAVFHFTLSDGVLTSLVGMATITTTNNNPTAGTDNEFTFKNQALDIPVADLLANDVNADGTKDHLIITDVQPGDGANPGAVKLDDTTNTIYYTPKPGITGLDTFTYTLENTVTHAIAFEAGTVNVAVIGVTLISYSFDVVDGSGSMVEFQKDGTLDEGFDPSHDKLSDDTNAGVEMSAPIGPDVTVWSRGADGAIVSNPVAYVMRSTPTLQPVLTFAGSLLPGQSISMILRTGYSASSPSTEVTLSSDGSSGGINATYGTITLPVLPDVIDQNRFEFNWVISRSSSSYLLGTTSTTAYVTYAQPNVQSPKQMIGADTSNEGVQVTAARLDWLTQIAVEQTTSFAIVDKIGLATASGPFSKKSILWAANQPSTANSLHLNNPWQALVPDSATNKPIGGDCFTLVSLMKQALEMIGIWQGLTVRFVVPTSHSWKVDGNSGPWTDANGYNGVPFATYNNLPVAYVNSGSGNKYEAVLVVPGGQVGGVFDQWWAGGLTPAKGISNPFVVNLAELKYYGISAAYPGALDALTAYLILLRVSGPNNSTATGADHQITRDAPSLLATTSPYQYNTLVPYPTLPNVNGMSVAAAKAALTGIGYVVRTKPATPGQTLPATTVKFSSPSYKDTPKSVGFTVPPLGAFPPGTIVTLYVY